MTTIRAFVRAALLVALCATGAFAQTIRGVVTGSGNAPLPGVVVALLDSASGVVARSLTNERGEYRVVAPGAGTYTLRTLRIGYRPSTSRPISVVAGQDVVHAVAVATIAVALDTMRVAERPSCRIDRDSAATTFAVWEQVRTALTAAQLTASARALRTTIVTYDRTLDRDFRRVRDQTASITTGFVTQPWRTLAPDALRRSGYVVDDPGGLTTYYAPGLDMLVASAFLEDHCFRLAAAAPGELGLAFTPIASRKDVAEIEGTLWLDRATAELRRLSYRYANIPRAQAEHAGGDLAFARLRDGSWAITRWSIRMPAFALFLLPNGKREPRIAEVHVTGGDLALATRGADARDTVYARAPWQLAGTVTDSASGAPLADARVSLVGTLLHAATGADGRFAIADVLPGVYDLEVRTRALDAIGTVYRERVELVDSTTTFAARVPPAESITGALCRGARGMADAGGDGIVLGFVYARGDSTPRRNVVVSAEWVETSVAGTTGGASVQRRTRSKETRTDDGGAFRLCGVPRATALVVRAAADTAGAAREDVRIADGERVARTTLTLDPRQASSGSFAGTVYLDSVRSPIADVEIALPELGLTTRTDASGSFRIADIPVGAQHVIVRRVGYGPLDTRVTITANRTVERTIYLSRVRTLDSVVVTATRDVVMEEFEANRKIGLGKFLTRADLELVTGRHLGDVFRTFAGVQVLSSGAGAAWIAVHRGAHNFGVDTLPRENAGKFSQRTPLDVCYPQVYLDDVLLTRGEVPNINRFTPDEIEGIEFYKSGAETPLKYSGTGAHCGAIVIHTRRTP